MFELQYLVMRAQSKASKPDLDDFPTVPMFFHGYEAKFPQREGGFTHQKGPLWDEIEHDWTSLSLWKMRGFHHVFSPCVFDPDMGLDIPWTTCGRTVTRVDHVQIIWSEHRTEHTKSWGIWQNKKAAVVNNHVMCNLTGSWFLYSFTKTTPHLISSKKKGWLWHQVELNAATNALFFVCFNTQHGRQTTKPWFWPRQVNKKKYTVLLAWFRSRRGEVHLFWPFLEAGLRIWNYPCGSWKKWPIATLCWPKLGNPLVSQ